MFDGTQGFLGAEFTIATGYIRVKEKGRVNVRDNTKRGIRRFIRTVFQLQTFGTRDGDMFAFHRKHESNEGSTGYDPVFNIYQQHLE